MKEMNTEIEAGNKEYPQFELRHANYLILYQYYLNNGWTKRDAVVMKETGLNSNALNRGKAFLRKNGLWEGPRSKYDKGTK